MGLIIEIKTDKNVYEFIVIFNDKSDIEITNGFDSANYGIGYSFNVREVTCRLFDDLDYSMHNDEKMLFIEIDRNDTGTLSGQNDVSDYLKTIIKQAGFEIN